MRRATAATLLVAVLLIMGVAALAVMHQRADVGIMAATTYGPRANHSLIMLSLDKPVACRPGDWVVCLRRGQVGRVREVLGDLAACEMGIALGAAAVGDEFRLF